MAFYHPRFVPQLDGSILASKNCNMAAAATFADAVTLGIKRYTGAQMRRASGDTEGGTSLRAAVTALSRLAHLTLDLEDGLSWIDLASAARRGFPFILHGDYDVLPYGLQGSRTFKDIHSVFGLFDDGWLIYDPLDDGRALSTGHAPQGPIFWPEVVVRAYAEKYPGPAIMAGFGVKHYVRSCVAVANIRTGPSRTRRIIGTLRKGGTPPPMLLTGGTVPGESIGGNSRWWKVWKNNRVAYMHTSVAVSAKWVTAF